MSRKKTTTPVLPIDDSTQEMDALEDGEYDENYIREVESEEEGLVEIDGTYPEWAEEAPKKLEAWAFRFERSGARISLGSATLDYKNVPLADLPNHVFDAMNGKLYRWNNLVYPAVSTGQMSVIKEYFPQLSWEEGNNLSCVGHLTIEV